METHEMHAIEKWAEQWSDESWNLYDSGGGCEYFVSHIPNGEVGISPSETMPGHFLAVVYAGEDFEEVAALTFFPDLYHPSQIWKEAVRLAAGERLGDWRIS